MAFPQKKFSSQEDTLVGVYHFFLMTKIFTLSVKFAKKPRAKRLPLQERCRPSNAGKHSNCAARG